MSLEHLRTSIGKEWMLHWNYNAMRVVTRVIMQFVGNAPVPSDFPAYFSGIMLPSLAYLFYRNLCRQIRRRSNTNCLLITPRFTGKLSYENDVGYVYWGIE